MMKKLISLLFFVTPMAAFAHPGHGIEQQVHGFLHGEHLIVLLAIVAAVIIRKIFR